ncbi:hypothetical protein [Streptomyces silvensis]|uniref:Uncharacterized protein n=1 Tax=Streptomyces silvensis TaxID=1765722 RepID=A0A0W7X7S5_9ACTN|nr:hypothetical protein [Streptomyces silvensis]KUF18778.1 hypothetical protein AT728_06970 [Streptomyces silvensis]
MWGTVIAVLGTLAGVALASAAQVRSERRTRREQQRDALSSAVEQVLGALETYRELHWLLIADTRAGDEDTREARATRYRARTEVTRARDRLALLTDDPALTAAADAAVEEAIRLSYISVGRAVDGRFADHVEADLAAGRRSTKEAHNVLRRAATDHVHRRGPRRGRA